MFKPQVLLQNLHLCAADEKTLAILISKPKAIQSNLSTNHKNTIILFK